MTGGIHHASNYDMLSHLSKGVVLSSRSIFLTISSKESWKCIWFVIWDVCSSHCSTKAPEKKTLLLEKFTLSATIMFTLNFQTLPHCYLGTYV